MFSYHLDSLYHFQLIKIHFFKGKYVKRNTKGAKMNFHKADIKELIDGLTPYPENVFVEEQAWLNNHFMPLISIDMGILRADLKGTVVHMLNPFEPIEGLIGEDTEDFHNEFCGENWLAFQLTEDNQYRFLADEQYFYFAPQYNHADDWFAEDIEENREIYQKRKAIYTHTGKLIPDENKPDSIFNFLDNLGGIVEGGNWVGTADIPTAFEMIEAQEIKEISEACVTLRNIQADFSTVKKEDIDKLNQKKADVLADIEMLERALEQKDDVTIKYKGEDFIFVADVAGYQYCEHGADAILMFYEPKSRIVLFTYDWS